MNEFTSQPADEAPSSQGPQSQAQSDEPPVQDWPPSGQSNGHQAGYASQPALDQLYRPAQGRMIAGVAAGIAQYLGVDATLVRIALAVLTVIGGAGIPVYVVGWLLIPDEETGESIASDLISSLQSRPS
ncbi:MAG TPA: PspC domain-containing protein [Streptosporangiaceae bacterium]|jgi:phage shock protein PspC (stress-responsive transcriptional regulator)|nr:PspC domain-containing protein [Streptosporangiaceae bacterium]